MTKELWADVAGYEGYYQVSTNGRVKSLPRTTHRQYRRWGKTVTVVQPIRERIMRPADGGGYMLVMLNKGGRARCFSVHSLVLTAFVGPRPGPKMEGCHNDGDYRNNKVGNLRWDTHKGNHQDRIRHGTNNRGEKNGSARLTAGKVKEARSLYATGKYLLDELASMYGVTAGAMGNAIHGRTWKHVKYLPKSDFGRGVARLRLLQAARLR